MHIRPALPEEAELLGALACASKAWWGYAEAQIDVWRDELSPSAESIRAQPTFIADIDGIAAGFYQLILGDDVEGELKNLWVLPRFMRQGVGSALLAHAVASAARRQVAALAINADSNAEAF